jgi:hypothetical protein
MGGKHRLSLREPVAVATAKKCYSQSGGSEERVTRTLMSATPSVVRVSALYLLLRLSSFA